MGNSKSKTQEDDETAAEFVRNANHEQLSRAIQSKGHEDNEKVVSKKEALKVLKIQKEQMNEVIEQLDVAMRNDELAARRFITLKKQELATLALKKRVLHVKRKEELGALCERHTELESQIKTGQLNTSISKALMKASTAIHEAEGELKDDYIRQCRRPQFDLRYINDQFEAAGIKDEDIIFDLNALWMENLEESLAEDEEEDRQRFGMDE